MKADPEVIKRIIQEADTKIDFDSFNEVADLRDIGADSLDMMTIILEVQTKYDLEIPDDQIENLTSVSKICRYING
jgi:acyl carrier protein